jgi:hypothetical protein
MINRVPLERQPGKAARVFFACANIRINERLRSMFHNILLVVLGLVLIGVLTAIFETLGLKNHPYVARILAAVCIVVGASAPWGYHSWWQVLIVIAFGFAYLQIMKEFLHASKEKSP